MRVLVACEFSGIVRDAFIARGHDALSCDLLPTERDGPHYQGDVRDLLQEQWDILIAFPPCTYLSYVQECRMKEPGREEKRKKALEFVRLLMNTDIPRYAIENPLGIIQTAIRKYDQIIQPYNFGHEERKRTCLWLKNLPPLMNTLVNPYPVTFINKLSPSFKRKKQRSRTFQGIADAMAEQWGTLQSPKHPILLASSMLY